MSGREALAARCREALAGRYAVLDELGEQERERAAAYRALPAKTKRVRAAQRAIRRRLDEGPATIGQLRQAVHTWPDGEGRNPREHVDEALDDMRDELAVEVGDDGRARYSLLPEFAGVDAGLRHTLPMEGNPR